MKRTPLKRSFSKIKSSNKPIKSSNKKIKRSRKKTVEKKKEQQQKRNRYFEYHLERCNRSEESYKPITSPTKANICHLLDKSRHPSVEDILTNCIHLTFSEHERFDQLLFSHRFTDLEEEFKNSWKNTCDKFKYLLSLCEENTALTRALNKYLDARETIESK